MPTPKTPQRAIIALCLAESKPTLKYICCLYCLKALICGVSNCKKVNNNKVCEQCKRINKPCHNISHLFLFTFLYPLIALRSLKAAMCSLIISFVTLRPLRPCPIISRISLIRSLPPLLLLRRHISVVLSL
jgi:hypothetical protein